MAKVTVYNLEGKQTGDMDLDDSVFGVALKPEVVQFVVRAQQANSFQPSAHTKIRSEVRGGGRKPWKQKGTGRARQGSIRSPQWVGGGIVFGPRNTKNPSLKINKKVKRTALRMVLSDKAASQRLLVVDSFDGIEGKTKQLAALLNTLPSGGRSTILASAGKNDALRRAAQNIQKTNTMLADSLNVFDLVKHQYVVVDKAGIEKLVDQLK